MSVKNKTNQTEDKLQTEIKSIQEPSKEKNQKKERSRIFELLFLIVFGGLILFWLIMSFYKAYAPKPQYLQGQIAAREYSVSSKLPGRVEDLKVKKGDFIQQGELVYRISSPELDAKYTQAQAGYEIAKALNEETHKGAREESIASARDVWNAARAMADLAKKTYHRVEELYQSGVVSLQRRDEAYAAYKSAQYNENVTYQQYQIALQGARSETKEAAAQKQRVAQGQIDEVEAYRHDSNVYAPHSGEVSNVILHNGELSPSGFPVVMLLDMSDSWLRLSVSEDHLNRFQKDQVFEGYVPALKRNIQFKVRYVSVMGDFATWKATSETKGYDMKSYEVEAVPLEAIKDFRVGMSVLVKVP